MLDRTYQIERSKWDALAAHKGDSHHDLLVKEDFQQYAARSSTMTGVGAFLGDLDAKHVLEFGCGLGELSVLLAKSRARVTAFDLSPASVAFAQHRAEANSVAANVHLAAAAGEALPFADNSFDLIFGKAILHHLNVGLGAHELYRVLKPGGRAAFVEPMGMNPALRFARAYLPYPNKNPRGADRPLNYREIKLWGKAFKEFHYRELQLLSMLERGLGFRRRLKVLRRLDNALLRHVPFMRRYCRYVVLTMVK
jgi:ubiquinone/menaquinone biosynthesis C-methylase UbiE